MLDYKIGMILFVLTAPPPCYCKKQNNTYDENQVQNTVLYEVLQFGKCLRDKLIQETEEQDPHSERDFQAIVSES